MLKLGVLSSERFRMECDARELHDDEINALYVLLIFVDIISHN
jgi:hypothetical protein